MLIRAVVAGECGLILEGLKSIISHPKIDLIAETRCLDTIPHIASNVNPDAVIAAVTDNDAFASTLSSFDQLSTRCSRVCILPRKVCNLTAIVAEEEANTVCLPMDVEPRSIFAAVHATVRRNGRRSQHRVHDRFPLTPRELEVLKILAQGTDNEHIAKQLFVTTATVKAHLTSIYRKIGVKNRTEAMAVYEAF